MTKTDLIAQVAANTEMSKKSAEMAVNAAFEALGKAMADELDTVPATLPALMRAQKLQKRAARFGCGPEDAAEAAKALDSAKSAWDEAQTQESAGELLLAAADAMRLAGVDAEEALTFAAKRFTRKLEADET